MRDMSTNRIISILIILSLLCVLLSLIIISNNQSYTQSYNCYKISIYEIYPWYFWATILVPIINLFLILDISYNCCSNHCPRIVISILISLLSIFIVLSIPFFNGYLFYGAGDTHTHLGMVKDIASKGHIGRTNVYPVIHLFVYVVATILDISFENTSLFIPQIFFFIYFISIYPLVKSLGYSMEDSLFITSFAVIPFIGFWLTREYIMPSTFSFFLLPIMLYIILKTRTSDHMFEYSILLVLFLLLLPFFHLETVLFILISLVIMSILFKVSNQMPQIINRNFCVQRSDFNVPLILLLASALFWFTSTFIFGRVVVGIYNSILLGVSPTKTPIDTLVGGFNISYLDSLVIIVRSYGPALLCLTIVAFLSIRTIIRFLSSGQSDIFSLLLQSLFISYITANFLFLLRGTEIGMFIHRQLKYSVFISIIIIALHINTVYMDKQNHSSIKSRLIIILILSLCTSICILNLYPSPKIQSINYQNTNSDVAMMTLFLDCRNITIPIIEGVTPRAYQNRYADYIYGSDLYKPGIRWAYNSSVFIPNHFSYDHCTNLGNQYISDHYMLLYPPINVYQEFYRKYPTLQRFVPEDFVKLYEDNSVSHIYNNQELNIFLIEPISM